MRDGLRVHFCTNDRDTPFSLDAKNYRPTFISFSWEQGNDFLRIVGIVFHEILQHIGTQGIEHWSVQQWQSTIPFYKKRLRQWQLNTSEVDKAILWIDKSMQRLVDDSYAKWILSNQHQSICQEYALSAYHNQQLTHIIMDRTFIDNGVRWIIDYKITSCADQDNPLFDAYRSQLELYQTLMKKFDSQYPIKTGVYFPLQCQWVEF